MSINLFSLRISSSHKSITLSLSHQPIISINNIYCVTSVHRIILSRKAYHINLSYQSNTPNCHGRLSHQPITFYIKPICLSHFYHHIKSIKSINHGKLTHQYIMLACHVLYQTRLPIKYLPGILNGLVMT